MFKHILVVLFLIYLVSAKIDPRRPWKGHSFPERQCRAKSCSPLGELTDKYLKQGNAAGVASRVLVIGLDGLGGWYITPENLPSNVKLPNLDALRENGTYTYFARSVMPTVSKPNWMAILSGSGPEENGVLDNDWTVGSQWEPVTGNNTYFPSLFQAIKSQSQLKTACFTDWDGFLDLFPNNLLDFTYLTDDPGGDKVTNEAISQVLSKDAAEVVVLHIDDVDEAGHYIGWGTPSYYEAAQNVDKMVGRLLDALDRAGTRDKTLIIVTSDHGGEGTGHGETDYLNMFTTLIINGPSIKRGYYLPCPSPQRSCYNPSAKNPFNVRNLDVSPTVLYALGLSQPVYWIGKPILEALVD